MKPTRRREAVRRLHARLSDVARDRLATLDPGYRRALEDWALKPWTARGRRARARDMDELLVTGVAHTGLAGEGNLRAPMLTMMFGPWDWEHGTADNR